MTFPNIRHAAKHRIGRLIYANGPMTAEDAIALSTPISRQKFAHRKAINLMIREGQIIDSNGVLSLTDEMKAGYADLIETEVKIAAARTHVEIVQKRDVRGFNSGALSKLCAALRNKTGRDIYFKNAGASLALPIGADE